MKLASPETVGRPHTWIEAKSPSGVSYGRKARRFWRCTTCTLEFTHYYTSVPEFLVAMRNARISASCKGVRI